MNADKNLTEINLGRPPEIKKCPICHAWADTDERICRSCGADLFTRVCSICMKTIPADEDPCHYCGHLEPAKSPISPASRGRGRITADISIFTLFLVLGLAMIIWPAANQPDVAPCVPDEEFSCFFETSWGVPGGIVLITLSALSLVLSVVSRHLRRSGRK